MPSTSNLPQSFLIKKKRILESLAVPSEAYDDLSPKGSVDEGIRDLIDEINQLEACVTTSSCAGRISVFLEGKKTAGEANGQEAGISENGERETLAGIGGKGGGGRWLFVSHDRLSPADEKADLAAVLGMTIAAEEHAHEADRRLIHFKFEPMILHVLAASLSQAQIILSAALQAGFRESGAINLIPSGKEPATPMVAVRSMGLTLESLIGYHSHGVEFCTVSPRELRNLIEISNARFGENEKRISRFRELLKKFSSEDVDEGKRKGEEGEQWEDAGARRERKKAEGLARRKQLAKSAGSHQQGTEESLGLDSLTT